MLNENKDNNRISRKIYTITQFSSERKSEPTKQPFVYFKTTTQNFQTINSNHSNPTNTNQDKTKILSGNSGKEFTTITTIRRRNEGTGDNKTIQTTNNYRIFNNNGNTTTNSKDIDHKKYGIRQRHFHPATPLITTSNNDKDKIIIKTKPNIDHKNYGIRQRYYQTASTPFYPSNNYGKDKIAITTKPNILSNYKSSIETDSRNAPQNPLNKYKYDSNYNSSKNIFITGSSQSNYLYSNLDNLNNLNQFRRNNNVNDLNNNKTSDVVKITVNKRSSLNNNNFTTTVIKSKPSPKSLSLPNEVNNNNTISHINESKKTPRKSYVLNERKNVTIMYEPRRYKYSNSKSKEYATNTDNHSLVVSRNVTKEKDNITNLKQSGKYLSNNPSLTNIITHSIDATHKKDKKPFVATPRKIDIIISNKPHIKIYNTTTDPNKPSTYNTNFRNLNNIFETKYNTNKYEPKTNINSGNNKTIYESPYLKNATNDLVTNEFKVNEPLFNKYSTITSNNNRYSATQNNRNIVHSSNNSINFGTNKYNLKTNEPIYKTNYNNISLNEPINKYSTTTNEVKTIYSYNQPKNENRTIQTSIYNRRNNGNNIITHPSNKRPLNTKSQTDNLIYSRKLPIITNISNKNTTPITNIFDNLAINKTIFSNTTTNQEEDKNPTTLTKEKDYLSNIPSLLNLDLKIPTSLNIINSQTDNDNNKIIDNLNINININDDNNKKETEEIIKTEINIETESEKKPIEPIVSIEKEENE